ncbi:MAG: chromosome segregation protein SMC [bacterium]
MKIKEIRLYGFKSFQGETKFLLNPGITAFVGPNGSGKSNIFDALRWVFGEQSMKALRCERNEDLIHLSADGQDDSNFAEVTVTIDNEEFFPQFGSEFEIRRRFYRDGESEFYLNRVKCRLQDIQALFLNSGTLTYSFLELAEIEKIISGDTKEMFDDVAGILKYQERREQTKKRLEQTEQDLLRLEDVIGEMERTVRALKRQARQTQLYQELKEDFKKLSLILLKNEYENTASDLKNVHAQINSLNQQKMSIIAKINDLEQERQKLKNEQSTLESKKKKFLLELNNLNATIESLQQELQDRENEARQFSLEQEKKNVSMQEKKEYLKILLSKTAGYETRIKQISSELENLNSKFNEEKQNLESLSENFSQITQQIKQREKLVDEMQLKIQLLKNDIARLEMNQANKQAITEQLAAEKDVLLNQEKKISTEKQRLGDELNKIISEQEKISATLLQKQQDSVSVENRISELEDNLQKLQEELSECRTLIDTLNNRLGTGEDIKLIKQNFKDKIAGFLRECVVAHSGYEAIVDICLRDTLNYFILNGFTPDDFNNLPEGRFGFILHKEMETEPIPADLSSLKSVSEFMEFKNHKKFLSGYLSRFFITNNLRDAFELADKYPQYGFVTPEAILFYNNAIIVQKGDFGYFRISQRLNEYRTKAETIQNEIIFINDEKKRLIAKTGQIKSELENNKDQLFSLNIKKSEISMQLTTLKQQLENISKDIAAVDNEQNKTKTEIQDIDSKIEKYYNEIKEYEDKILEIQNEITQLGTNQKEVEEQINKKNEELNQLVLKIGINEELQRATDKEFHDTMRTIKDLEEEINEASNISTSEQLGSLNQTIFTLQQKIQEKKEKKSHLENQMPDSPLEQLAKDLDTIYDELTKIKKEQEEIQSTIMQLNYTVFQLNHRKEELTKKAQDEFQTDLDEFIPEEVPEPEQKLNEVRERMIRVGEINPLSLSAYEQEKKRLDEFLAQRNDIIAAKQNLLKSIAELDARAQERFTDIFNEVKDKFNQVFSKFFEGGEADLLLTDPSNPLTTQVDIVVRMKGKKIKRINQLSGGERTLLAVSLLLAFYLVKPAPFCILDEIDAPLDDVNVVRFNKFLRELSQHTQVVIITHNRSTMEYADYLYGLTMEQPGKSKIVSTRLEDLEPPIGV